jgi:hypothetical protein
MLLLKLSERQELLNGKRAISKSKAKQLGYIFQVFPSLFI